MNEILESSAVPEPLGHPPSDDDSRRIREHLKHLLTDPLFNHSKRLPAFLRYVVKEALDGVPDGQIKERTLGVVVFGRPHDYDTNTDPVVRVTAGEVRKKLAQYYYANQDSDIQIEVPLGSYIPRFRVLPVVGSAVPAVVGQSVLATFLPLPVVVGKEPVAAASPAMPRSRGWLVASVASAILLGIGLISWRVATRQTPIDSFWSRFATPSREVTIVLPALSRAPQALPIYHFEAESVAIEDAEVATRISNEFKLRKLESHLVLATNVSLSDLRSTPFVLIGALDNVWTMRLSQGLPFAFERSEDRRYGRIVDRKDPSQSWSEDFSVPNAMIPQDYGIIAAFTDPTTEQPTILIAGISAEGTLAAGEAVTTPRYLEMLLKSVGPSPGGFEAVIETKVIDGKSGPPNIVAKRTW